MIVDLKVHVEIVHYQGRQGSNMRPRECFYFFSWVCESIFFGERASNIFEHETLAKDKHGVRERFANAFFIHEEWPFADQGI